MQEKRKIDWKTIGEVVGPDDKVFVSDILANNLDDTMQFNAQQRAVLNFMLLIKVGSTTQPIVGTLNLITVSPEETLTRVAFNVIIDDALKVLSNIERLDVIGYEISYAHNIVTTVMRRFAVQALTLKDHDAETGTCVLDVTLTL